MLVTAMERRLLAMAANLTMGRLTNKLQTRVGYVVHVLTPKILFKSICAKVFCAPHLAFPQHLAPPGQACCASGWHAIGVSAKAGSGRIFNEFAPTNRM
ncbi:hypothetical protein PF005_g31253 [Phytophthora fragariae]|uniref:Uncharacterized protein n=1 Tax=Phytophthora fragariae TaxID=53985 RepID=A0A6A3DA74_9STRA|nr:hypothetical protein PF009_g31312 [Phytophthora fragariae]KAE8976884.1 hypothetical protein PF011_g23874 [Phytophthora fragariae]KAE9058512.1 hypothetical protein PF010_g30967 [Phytophthora fragariae]KAE9063228.1 hypothetical protein PF006_g30998 [Phytophthora fragariae]KAE9074779.1 hypothetical protein PF007_g25272 [Phytophthora fragariae]